MNLSYCTKASILMDDGRSKDSHWEQIKKGETLLKPVAYEGISGYASMITPGVWERLHSKYVGQWTRCTLLALEVLDQTNFNPDEPDQLVIISTTKGDIDLLNANSISSAEPAFRLAHIGDEIQSALSAKFPVLTISNACISGNQAIMLADGYLKSSCYSTVYVVGLDLFTHFTFLGFNSFKAISDVPCQPFDVHRRGISLGEGAACIKLTVNPDLFENKTKIVVSATSLTNDANHISGPSRNGNGLYKAMIHCLEEGRFPEMINLHGTGTLFNDDMERIAITRAGLSSVASFGLKGYCGHTLGAAGVIESIFTLMAMSEDYCPATIGLVEQEDTGRINLVQSGQNVTCNTVWKSTSGFGGGNCLLAFEKIV